MLCLDFLNACLELGRVFWDKLRKKSGESKSSGKHQTVEFWIFPMPIFVEKTEIRILDAPRTFCWNCLPPINSAIGRWIIWVRLFNYRHPDPWRAWKGGSAPQLLTPLPVHSRGSAKFGWIRRELQNAWSSFQNQWLWPTNPHGEMSNQQQLKAKDFQRNNQTD